MANIALFSSLCSLTFAVAAVVVARDSRPNWWRRMFASSRRDVLASPEPRIVTDGGWTTIYCEDVTTFSEWLGQDEVGLPHDPTEIPSLGSHLLIELYGCDSKSLTREETVGAAMNRAAEDSDATVVAQSFHEFKPYGVSGAVIIQESHYTIHTWPEHKYAAVDLFYCGGTVKVHRAVEVLQNEFRPERIRFLVVRRGLQSEVGS